jgi:formylmethanofuran dehydrogenase subunit E
VNTKTISELLDQSAALHRHLCPRQVLGVRMGCWGGELLGLELPQANKRLLTIVETDGCFTDGVSVATNCWVGRRTLRIEDYGKAAATFVDTVAGRALRLAPDPHARELAANFAPEANNRWEAMLLGYQRMEPQTLFVVQQVELNIPIEVLISRPGCRALCDRCGEEIMNEREIALAGLTLCRACAGPAYYRPAEPLVGSTCVHQSSWFVSAQGDV